ncbi:MAG: imidazolonepropionase [Caldilinea sp. CFX5]|nr:imidazolonepropionase [Caldilinea sp. CFX5]
MITLFTDITELYTPFDRLTDAALVVENGRIAWLGARADLPPAFAEITPTALGNRGVLPGFVDSHTHLVWAGSRLDEYLQRARGESYEAILEAGGGIYNTVTATQRASEEELFQLAQARALHFQREGVSTLEVKSGYGLEPEHELKMLRVIQRLAATLPQHIFPTLLAHVIPKDWTRTAYVDMFCRELIPEVKRAGLATAVDVFCDRGAFTLVEAEQIFTAALDHGLAIKAHAEQIERTGVSQLVAKLHGLSADHLEQSTVEDWQALAAAQTVATFLPGAAVILRKPFPNLRAMQATGVKLAVATDHNPGSSPLYSLVLALQLAVALGGLSVEDALIAGTAHAADALGQPTLGRLAVGAPADFVVVRHERALAPFYTWGHTQLATLYMAGEKQF